MRGSMLLYGLLTTTVAILSAVTIGRHQVPDITVSELLSAPCRTGGEDSNHPFWNKEPTPQEIQAVVDKHQEYLTNATEELRTKAAFLLADFTCAKLSFVDWTKIRRSLARATFQAAKLISSDFGPRLPERFGPVPDSMQPSNGISLEGADFRAARLYRATFNGNNLRNATFENSNLMKANFFAVDVAGVTFDGAQLDGVNYQPRASASSISMFAVSGVERMSFISNPAPLIELRTSMRRSGQREIERQITYAIESSRTSKNLGDGEWLAAAARFIAWDIPVGYELVPGQARAILVALIFVFAGAYWEALGKLADPQMWRVFPSDRLHGDGKIIFEAVRVTGLNRIRFALIFSVFSAFHLGWRDLNVGVWLSRLQGTEYTLRGSGWVRTVSGLQSLISVYLLAMWALTQFGRLFEG